MFRLECKFYTAHTTLKSYPNKFRDKAGLKSTHLELQVLFIFRTCAKYLEINLNMGSISSERLTRKKAKHISHNSTSPVLRLARINLLYSWSTMVKTVNSAKLKSDQMLSIYKKKKKSKHYYFWQASGVCYGFGNLPKFVTWIDSCA